MLPVGADSVREDFLWFQQHDRQLMKRINQLITDAAERARRYWEAGAARGDWSGSWSRRIDREHRLVYRLTGETVEIAGCRYHYVD